MASWLDSNSAFLHQIAKYRKSFDSKSAVAQKYVCQCVTSAIWSFLHHDTGAAACSTFYLCSLLCRLCGFLGSAESHWSGNHLRCG